ncbi:rCG65885 [Rattus norvegicus]|uniref:RCG65885 n=2 Tax=Rattus norvegicus TaxID=10116 RepID=A0A9K3Y706_RAT|nr:Similar to testis-specific transporter TST-2 [Rattus norvegicus]EDL91881.1 rCG65885 [Rattus norvegicus]|eukprot:NP_001014292.1 solute carrier organic anion transporter family, member 6d1 [Rattus norvegicus]
MDKVKNRTSNRVEQVPVVEGDEHRETAHPRKIETYMKTVPRAMKKFADIPEEKMPHSQFSDSLEEGSFGLGPLVFPCLQRFNNINCFLTAYFLGTMAHGMIFGLVDQSLKVYVSELSPSKLETLTMGSGDDLAAFLVSLVGAHFGGRGNRVRWMVAACFVTGLASMVFAIPFFNYEIIKLGTVTDELCIEGKKTTKVCERTVIPHKSTCIAFFNFGQFLHGIAAIADTALSVGYVLGYLVGIRNRMFPVKEDMKAVGHVQQFRILQRNWWRSYFAVAVFAFCTTLPLSCFPSRLRGAQQIRLEKSKEPPTIDRRLKDKEIQPGLKGVLHAIWCLLRNPLVLTQTFCQVTKSLTLKSSGYFLPKFLQSHFLIVPTNASILTGMFVLPGALIGRFLGGYIVDRLQMSTKVVLKFMMVSSFISVVLFLLTFFWSCETAGFAGINDDYDGLGKLGNFTAPCNEYCGCTMTDYSTICGRDEKQYFSACFAGCRASKPLRKEKAYYNCSCIKEGLTAPDDDGQFFDAVSGTCNTKCLTLPLLFAFYFAATVFSNFCSVPSFMIVLKSVPASWNSMSLGVTYTIWRFLGSVPDHLLFESTSDYTCNFWDINSCGEKGRCWIYNKKNLLFTFQSTYKHIEDIKLNKGICDISARSQQGISMQISTGLLCLYGIYRHDYVVKEKNKSLPIHVKDEKEKEKKSLISN